MSDNYLPLFTSLRKDRRVKRLRKDHGNEGYGVFISVLQILREEPNFSYPIQDIDLLADDVECSEKLLKDVIVSYDLFTINSIEMFFSLELNAAMQPYLEKTERMRALANKRWKKAEELGEGSHNDVRTHMRTDMRTHSDSIAHVERTESVGNANKRKEKEKKDITHSKNASDSIYPFESFWDDYEKKIDRKKCKAVYDKLSEKDREEICNSIGLYVIAYPEKKYRKNPLTYLNGRCWEDDIEDILESRKVDSPKKSNPTPTTHNNLTFL